MSSPVLPVRTAPPTARDRFPWPPLLVLSSVIFLSVTAEMMPTGLLPELGASFGVSPAQAGLLVTVFAFTVVLSSTPLALLTRRVPRRTLLLAVLVVLTLGTVATALAPSYPLLIAARIVGGAGHGLFWAVVGAYSARLVRPRDLGRAVAVTFAGGTLAFVLGVPLGTALGQLVGWRVSFLIVAGLMAVGVLLVLRVLPSVETPVPTTTTGSIQALRPGRGVGAVAVLCVAVAVAMTGHYSFTTYLVPFATERMEAPAEAVSPLLFVYGAAGAVGLVIAGTRAVTRRPVAALLLALSVVLVSSVVLNLAPAQPLLALPAFAIWGVAFGVLPSLLQTRLLQVADPLIRDTATAVYTASFNAGIGAGALVGSVVYGAFGLESTAVVYAAGLVLAVALLAAASWRTRTRVVASAP
ncbi:MFS transporter [Rathayibacter sp. Leaf248]|uniref:MFS transporter n=1 Tax=Rathayibacter sp. Leaf248 TaxID=2876555 RepID=UPI001E3056F4|nr:MFS transporter [Rathayibacter sp. Leaf248]